MRDPFFGSILGAPEFLETPKHVCVCTELHMCLRVFLQVSAPFRTGWHLEFTIRFGMLTRALFLLAWWYSFIALGWQAIPVFPELNTGAMTKVPIRILTQRPGALS